ncbi:integrase core domain-containing protein [Streptomyces sp. NPDC056149]|uniref:integrase core domain-containing protein n=1 Tax=Streptomyces sp. NPDC056149 TaxID=3345728 RepID=UPI0035D6561E
MYGRNLDDVEIATLTWVDWHNNQRVHSSIGDVPPAEHEATSYGLRQTAQIA